MVRLYKKAKTTVVRAVTVLVRRVDDWLRRACSRHGSRLKTDATYAEVTAIVLSGLFGVVPVKDVVATVLAALLGVFANSRQARISHVSRYDDPWDLA